MRVVRSESELGHALEARLLIRLESTLHPPTPVVVGLAERIAQRVHVHRDAVLGEGHGIDVLPRWARTHDGVADVQENRPQRSG